MQNVFMKQHSLNFLLFLTKKDSVKFYCISPGAADMSLVDTSLSERVDWVEYRPQLEVAQPKCLS